VQRRFHAVVPLTVPEEPGPALGLLGDTIYDETLASLDEGDALVLFTDGLFEAANATGDEFGRKRLGDALASRLALSTPTLIDGALADIKAFQSAGTKGFEDDVCIVAVDRIVR
jgi:sigma-B regulation protein RsbU (phosphoserine phosphatase)